jgi:hypothetical protein
MPFSVSYQVDAGESMSIKSSQLRYSKKIQLKGSEELIPELLSEKAPEWLEAGSVCKVYNREGLRDKPEYLDIDLEEPISEKVVDSFAINDMSGSVYNYEGWIYAPENGLYQFKLPRKSEGLQFMGRGRSVCQNQLRIGGQVVAQHGVYGRNPRGGALLDKGWHKLSFRIGKSLVNAELVYPDQSIMPLYSVIYRESGVSILPDFADTEKSVYEIYEPTEISMYLPKEKDANIHYTTEGKLPTVNDPKYYEPFSINRSTKVIAIPFVDGKAIAKPTVSFFKKLERPKESLMCEWDFSKGGIPTKGNSGSTIWIHPNSYLDQDRDGSYLVGNSNKKKSKDAAVDTNVNLFKDEKNTFSIDGLRMNKSALSIALYFKAINGNKASGTLVSKQGYNAYGKGYRTIKLRSSGGRLRLDPGIIQSREKISEDWNLVVITVNPLDYKIYLDGKIVAEGMGNQEISTDSLDFFTEFPVHVRYVGIYNRTLSQRDIKALNANLKK